MNTADILFSEIVAPKIDKKMAVAEIKAIEEKFWVIDKYRNCHILPLMTKNGGVFKSDIQNERNDNDGAYIWTPFAPKLIKDYLEENVLNWTGKNARVTVIRTQPNSENPIHIDCSPEAFGSIQHKYRYVLQGYTDSLYFLTRDGEVKVPTTDRPFLMDGSWPHGMRNGQDDVKYTLSVGAPWSGSAVYPELGETLFKSSYKICEIFDSYYNPKYYAE